VATDRSKHGSPLARWRLSASFLAHGVALAGLVVFTLVRPEPPPPANSVARVFLVAPGLTPPPPPPPSPSTRVRVARRARPHAPPAQPPTVMPPVRAPDHLPAPDVSELDVREVARDAETATGSGADPDGVPGGVGAGTGVIGALITGVAEPPGPPEPVRVGGDVTEPAKLRHVPPVYPGIAIRARVQGTVVLECRVSPQGKVTAVSVVRGIPLLDEAAIAAVKQWLYAPTLRHGVPVPVLMTVTVHFGLA
jgi:protein TonB